MVKLCETSDRAFEQVQRARFVRRRPSEKQTVAPNVALLLIRARYYDPMTGEFTSRDPLEYVDGMSLYRAYFGIGGVDPLGEAVHHPYPLYLGGSNFQIGIDLVGANHDAAHRYFRERGYWGDQGRADWAALTRKQQKNIVDGSLKAAGVSARDRKKLLGSAFKGAKKGVNNTGIRGIGKSRFLRNALKGVAIGAVLYPYEVYADQGGVVLAFGKQVILCMHLQLLGAGQEIESRFIYHLRGEDYLVDVVTRNPCGKYFIARRVTAEGVTANGEVQWVIPDDKSCPANFLK